MGRKRHVYTQLAGSDILYLEMEGGMRFQVVQYASSTALNEIPSAACMLAIGREARSQVKAAVHNVRSTQTMIKARVFFSPEGEYDTTRNWPTGEEVIFEGFFVGFSYRKINGKVHAVARLLHWLAALTFSSCLTATGHVANPSLLNSAAILPTLLNAGGGNNGQGNNISSLVGAQVISGIVLQDLWAGLKQLLCELSQAALLPVTAGNAAGECLGPGSPLSNTEAQYALSKIEGPAIAGQASDCDRPYRWGVPLAIDGGDLSSALATAISMAIGQKVMATHNSQTFWDKIVGELCPLFGLAIVPMIDSAIIIADTPVLTSNAGPWRALSPDDHDDFNMDGELHHPLQAVGVLAGWQTETGPGQTSGSAGHPIIGGCYGAPVGTVDVGRGIRQYISPPPWLLLLQEQLGVAILSTGLNGQNPTNSGTTPVAGPPRPPNPGGFSPTGSLLYNRYAHTYYVNQILRGRTGSISGKLRFDIAPGSIVEMEVAPEQFIGSEDSLAFTLYGAVNRVSIAINAESMIAGTTFMFSHLRYAGEYQDERTSVPAHPLFGTAIHGGGRHGSPLKDAYLLE